MIDSKRVIFLELELVSSTLILLYVFMEIFLIYNIQGTIAFKTHIMDLGWVTFLELRLRVVDSNIILHAHI